VSRRAVAAPPQRPRAARCRATLDGGGVSVTQDSTADRWAGTRRGPGRQRLGAGQGSAVSESAQADKWGSAAQCARFGFQTESILFQLDSILPQTLTDLKGAFPYLKNWK
jgi:hypothetical protein